jgi:hypothetical protein
MYISSLVFVSSDFPNLTIFLDLGRIPSVRFIWFNVSVVLYANFAQKASVWHSRRIILTWIENPSSITVEKHPLFIISSLLLGVLRFILYHIVVLINKYLSVAVQNQGQFIYAKPICKRPSISMVIFYC